MAGGIPVNYNYSPLREVGALPLPPMEHSEWLGSATAPLHLELWDHFLADHADNAEYRAKKGEWYVTERAREEARNPLREWQDSIGVATNMFGVKNIFHDPSQAAIAKLNVKGNPSRDSFHEVDEKGEPLVTYDYFPADNTHLLTRREKWQDSAARRKGKLPLSDVVSLSPQGVRIKYPTFMSVNVEQESRATTLTASLDIVGALDDLSKNNKESSETERVAFLLDQMLKRAIVLALRQSIHDARKFAVFGGPDQFGRTSLAVVDNELQEGEHLSGNKLIRLVAKNSHPGAAYEGNRIVLKREKAAKKVLQLLEEAPIVTKL